MLPIYRSDTQTESELYDYQQIPPGYYFNAMLNGPAPQRFWHREKFRSIAELIPDRGTLVDVGCGPGSFLQVLKESHSQITAIGLDIASPQIEFANQFVKDQRISFQQVSPADSLPIQNATVDAVSSIEVIEHLAPYEAMILLQDMRQLLKPDGKLVITTPNYRSFWPLIELLLETLSPVKYHEQHINKFTPNSFVKFIETAGFEVLKVKTIFILSPFLAGLLGRSLALKLHKLEQRLPGLMGSLLVIEAKPLARARTRA